MVYADAKICDVGQSGMVFPAFGDDEQEWNPVLRAVLYAVGLVYAFMGVAIVADVFMASIEAITSRRTQKVHADGRRITSKVWNETVATLTLMALGSSAPEIFLSVIDIIKKKFHFGALGPATIVGSASFNLLIIVAVCMVVIPSSEVRVVENLPALYITAFFSMVAYVWMAVMLVSISPQIVEVWEALVTFLLLPVLVYVSYKVDRGDADRLLRCCRILPPEEEKEESGESFISFPRDTVSVPASMEAKTLDVTVIRKGDLKGEVSCNYSIEPLIAIPGCDYVDTEGSVTFATGESEQHFSIEIQPRHEWKNVRSFLVVLQEIEGEAQFNPEDDGGEESAILTVNIDSFETFGADKGLYSWMDTFVNMDGLKLALTEWVENLEENIYCNGSSEEQKQASAMDWASHLVALPWKFLFSFMPPTRLGGGWVCFFFSLGGIALLTAVVSDLAELFGCVIGIPDIVTAISFVALGTSMPDLFASLSSAKEDPTADASIVNVTGSNSVNVFLGLGVPWVFAAVHWQVNGPDAVWLSKYGHFVERVGVGKAAFIVEAEGLGFSVMVFCYLCVLALIMLHLRRKWLGCELGGPWLPKVTVSTIFALYWCGFVAIVSWWCLLTGEIGATHYGIILGSMAATLLGLVVFVVITKKAQVKPEATEPEPEKKEQGLTKSWSRRAFGKFMEPSKELTEETKEPSAENAIAADLGVELQTAAGTAVVSQGTRTTGHQRQHSKSSESGVSATGSDAVVAI